MTGKNRPYIICHMLSSIDGRISGDFFRLSELQPGRFAFGRIRSEFDCDGILYGAVTAAEVCADGYIEMPDHVQKKTPRKDFMAETQLNRFVIATDPEGKLCWSRNYVERPGLPKSHVIEILTEKAGDAYLAYLQGLGISYIIAGTEQLDCRTAAEKLGEAFGIRKILLAGGGAINWSFLQEGLIDELSLVTAPLTDGRRDTAAVFDRSPYCSENIPAAFSLLDVQKLDEDTLWLRYRPKNIRGK